MVLVQVIGIGLFSLALLVVLSYVVILVGQALADVMSWDDDA